MKSDDRPGGREQAIEACAASHRRLEAAIAGLSDAEARQPSLCAGWSVGHLVTHLARNADSHVRMLEGAERGEVLTQYEHGAEGRAADIEAGAHRPVVELVDDVRSANARLERTWSETSERAWAGSGRSFGGEMPTDGLPLRRWVESEIHHVDLGPLGPHHYRFSDVPSDLVGIEVRRLTALWASRQPMGLATLPAAALALAPHDRLAWLTGRLDVDGLPPAGVYG